MVIDELGHLSPTALAALWNAFWVFVGVVAGAMIQYLLGQLNVRSARRTASQVLQTEIMMNLDEAERTLERLKYLRDRIIANQIRIEDIFINMSGFDYSVLNPLVSSGYFHSVLGPEKIRAYLDFMRFFNNHSAEIINSTLKTEHERGKSVDHIDWLLARSSDLKRALSAVTQ